LSSIHISIAVHEWFEDEGVSFELPPWPPKGDMNPNKKSRYEPHRENVEPIVKGPGSTPFHCQSALGLGVGHLESSQPTPFLLACSWELYAIQDAN
jgi:hypothetical protein